MLGAVSCVHLTTEYDDLTEQEINFLTCEVTVTQQLARFMGFPNIFSLFCSTSGEKNHQRRRKCMENAK